MNIIQSVHCHFLIKQWSATGLKQNFSTGRKVLTISTISISQSKTHLPSLSRNPFCTAISLCDLSQDSFECFNHCFFVLRRAGPAAPAKGFCSLCHSRSSCKESMCLVMSLVWKYQSTSFKFSVTIAAMPVSVTCVPLRSRAKRCRLFGRFAAKTDAPSSLTLWHAKQQRSSLCKRSFFWDSAFRLLLPTPWQPMRFRFKVSKLVGKVLMIATRPSSPSWGQPSKSNVRNVRFGGMANFWSPILVMELQRPKLNLKRFIENGRARAISASATSVIWHPWREKIKKVNALGMKAQILLTPMPVTCSHLARCKVSSWSLGGRVGANLSSRSSVSCFMSVRFKFLSKLKVWNKSCCIVVEQMKTSANKCNPWAKFVETNNNKHWRWCSKSQRFAVHSVFLKHSSNAFKLFGQAALGTCR